MLKQNWKWARVQRTVSKRNRKGTLQMERKQNWSKRINTCQNESQNETSKSEMKCLSSLFQATLIFACCMYTVHFPCMEMHHQLMSCRPVLTVPHQTQPGSVTKVRQMTFPLKLLSDRKIRPRCYDVENCHWLHQSLWRHGFESHCCHHVLMSVLALSVIQNDLKEYWHNYLSELTTQLTTFQPYMCCPVRSHPCSAITQSTYTRMFRHTEFTETPL